MSDLGAIGPLGATLITARAEQDNLGPDDYRDIYEELRRGRSLRQFVELLRSAYSIAYWSQYERREIELARPARRELRRAVNQPDLPKTIGQAMADVDPDAEVWRVGEHRPDRVILIGIEAGGPGLEIRVNGKLEIGIGCDVTAVTSPRARPKRQSLSLSQNLFERLNSARNRRGQTWSEFLAPLLEDEEEEDRDSMGQGH